MIKYMHTEHSGGLSDAQKAGIIVGVLLAVLLLVFILVIVFLKKKRRLPSWPSLSKMSRLQDVLARIQSTQSQADEDRSRLDNPADDIEIQVSRINHQTEHL